jgi:hypothetical protein
MLPTNVSSLFRAVRSAIVPQLLALIFMQLAIAHGADSSGCLPQGKPVTLSGRLVRVDERGYSEWIGLVLRRPICSLADPIDTFKGAVSGVTALQAVSLESEIVGSQLRRLVGKRVVLNGKLTQWGTGYQRALLVFEVASVQPTDAAGGALLSAPEPPPPTVRDVPEYEVTIRAGRSLKIEAGESGTGKPLRPSSEYAPHWMTGGEVVYVNCRDGYGRKLTSSTDRQLSDDDDDDVGFGFNAYPDKPLVIKFRCIRADK